MRKLQQILFLTLSALTLTLCQVDLTLYNGKCVSCIQQNPLVNYYCTKTNVCSATLLDYQSCEKGLTTCLNYKAKDLGVQEIPPYNKTRLYFNETVKDGQGVKFAVSNQDSKQKAWVEVQISNEGIATKLDSVPTQFQMYQYDPNNNTITSDYIFSRTGKTYIKPLNTMFYYAAANNGGFTIHITYGNAKDAINMIINYGIVIGLCALNLLNYF